MKWNLLKKGWVKINTDEALNGYENYFTTGGVFCDSHGNWIAGFYQSIGRCPILTAELWTIYHSLRVTRRRVYSKVILKSDSKVIVNILNIDSGDFMMASLIHDIKAKSR